MTEPSVTPHQPARPQWTCSQCGYPWPCPGARARLRAAYDPVMLSMYLSDQLFTAAADLRQAELPPELVNRFLAWVDAR